MPLHCAGVRSHLGVKKMPESCQDWSPLRRPQGLDAFQYHSGSRSGAAILESEKTQLGMRLGLLWSMVSFRGKKGLAMPGLLSFNFKLMSEHPFHFPMGVLTTVVFYCSEEVCRTMP